MTEEKRYQIALSLVPKIGPVLSKQLINHFGSAEAVFKTPKGKLSKVPGLGQKIAEALSNQSSIFEAADEVITKSEKRHIDIHFYKDSSYPKRLLRINDAPIILYSKGKLNLNTEKTIGIVGTRKATQYGSYCTEQIVADAKASEVTIVSGLAYGIDVKAHRAALQNNVPTLGVLACGLDYVYPTAHQNTAIEMQQNGGLVSEYPVGTKADSRFFPARNRIIAALSDALIVVEAAIKGGALISANIAHSYDKTVFAVPGELGKTFSEGCNQLIQSLKARIYTSFSDVIEELNWDLQEESRVRDFKKQLSELDGSERKVVEVLLDNNQELAIDSLSWQCQIPLSQLASILLQLEFKGLVRPLPGKKYKLG